MLIAHEFEDTIDNLICKTETEGRRGCRLMRWCLCRQHSKFNEYNETLKRISKKLDDKITFIPRLEVEDGRTWSWWGEEESKPQADCCPHKLVGLEKDCNFLVKKMSRKDEVPKIVYMIGAGGSGKTTMASELFHHPEMRRHFERLIWVSVARHKNAMGVILDIHQHLLGLEEEGVPDAKDLVLGNVRDFLRQTPTMIILDDVRDIDELATLLFPLIKVGRSKVAITSRTSPLKPQKYVHLVDPEQVDNYESLARKLAEKETLVTSFFHTSKPNASLVADLFKDSLLEQHFHSRCWVPIGNSDYLDTKEIMLRILDAIDEENIKGGTKKADKSVTDVLPESGVLNLLEVINERLKDEKLKRLKDQIAKRNHLIVLDQVKDTQSLVEYLYPILQNGDLRSKVIFIRDRDNFFPSELHDNKSKVEAEEHYYNEATVRVGQLHYNEAKVEAEKFHHNEAKLEAEELQNTEVMVNRLREGGQQSIMFTVPDPNHTSLIQNVCEHQLVKTKFDKSISIRISREWDVETTIDHIVEEVKRTYQDGDPRPKLDDENRGMKLAKELLDYLQKRRCLLVLDAVHDEAKQGLVLDLMDTLKSNLTLRTGVAYNSKIIITVSDPCYFRDSNLTCYLYKMRSLEIDESWRLLSQIVVSHGSHMMQEIVDQIGKDEAEKDALLKTCHGLPLNVIVVAGILSTKTSIDDWERIMVALATNDTLLLSYHDLPSHIALCFLYLSLFPKHYEIPTGMLIRLWISEGFITESHHMLLEDVGVQYLEELARRCLIQVVKRNYNGEMKSFNLHQQIHELTITESAELGFLEKYPFYQEKDLRMPQLSSEENPPQQKLEELRRAALDSENLDRYPKESSKLRSFILFGKHGVDVKSFVCEMDALGLSLDPIHECFKLLRVLLLCGIKTSKTLPKQMGDLLFLTYLGLRGTSIQALPETIKKLQKLVTLEYRSTLGTVPCEPLPNVLSHMTALRHVYLPEFCMLPTKKLDLDNLDKLQTLWGVSGGDWRQENLEKLNPSLLRLGVVNISCQKDLDSLVDWLINRERQIRVLKLDWHTAIHGRVVFPKQNMHTLCNLQKLILVGRLDEDNYLKQLVSVVKLELFFSHLESSVCMENIGRLPKLKVLHLWNSYKGKKWTVGPNMFLKLEELRMSHLPNLKEWIIEGNAMWNLKKVSIFSCRKLEGLPTRLGDMKLQQLEILCMSTSFKNQQEVLDKIPHVKFEAYL